jgi:HD-GYP domain-containing protein (c-di-GMP phosphodiesterase class II)
MALFSPSETSLLGGMSHRLRQSLMLLRGAVETVWASDAPRIIQDYTDHGIHHVERVAGWAQQLRRTTYDAAYALSEKERYLLLAGIYMHDIGMQCDVQLFPQIKDKAVDLELARIGG